MKTLLYQYNPWWEEEYSQKNIIERIKYVKILKNNLANKQIIFLTGIRRVGKTTLMKILIKELLDKGTNKNKILYISMDDFLLNKKNIFDIIEEFRKIHKHKVEDKIFIFLDEITYQKDYHQQLKNLYDTCNIKIFATSSSSSLLKDKKAFLTGRSITFEVHPLDFNEFKKFKNYILKNRDFALNETYFKEFIKVGGLPENVLNPSRDYLMNLVDDIIQKDITAFYGLRNHQVLREFFTLLMERSGKQISLNKIANILKLSPDTARRYLAYFEETYLIHTITRWGKTNERILSPKKIYACDLGIKFLFMGERDYGSYFENYIYLKLKQKKETFYLYKDGIEIDFITSDKILIESKFYKELNDKQKKLFSETPAINKIVIDSIAKLDLLDDL